MRKLFTRAGTIVPLVIALIVMLAHPASAQVTVPQDYQPRASVNVLTRPLTYGS